MMKIMLEDVNTSVELSHLFLIQTIPTILGNLSMIPMGLIIADVTLVYLLTSISIPIDIAITVSLIFRIVHLGLSFLVGIVSMNYLMYKNIILPENKRLFSTIQLGLRKILK